MENGKELATKPKTGRPSLYNEKVAEEIIAACRSGFTMEKAGELVGMEPKTIQAWVTKRPAFGARVKKARKEHEISLLRSIEVAGEKSWQAKAWLAERVYSYAVPSSRLEVAGAIAHAHGATPNLAQLLANMNTAKSVNGIGNGALQLADREGGKLSESIGQRKVRRYSRRPTRRDIEGSYVNGKPHGYWIYGKESHYQWREGEYDEGTQIGTWWYYDTQGRKLMKQVFDDNGNLLEEKIYKKI